MELQIESGGGKGDLCQQASDLPVSEK